MKGPFTPFRGIAAALPIANVNTDAIIPSAFLRSQGADLARGLFGAWRFDADDRPRPEFVLNREPFRRAEILVVGENFGCGSSREAAVWALQKFGVRCLAAPSFADIFLENALRNGLLAATIDVADMAQLAAALDAEPDRAILDVDLERQSLSRGNDLRVAFRIPAFRRDALLRGEDEIQTTLRAADAISAYHRDDRARRSWMYRAIEPNEDKEGVRG